MQYISTQLVMWLKESAPSTEKENQMTRNNLIVNRSNETDSGMSDQRKADAKVLSESNMEPAERTLSKYRAEKVFSLFSKEMLQKLIVKDKNDEETLICDLGKMFHLKIDVVFLFFCLRKSFSKLSVSNWTENRFIF